MHDGPLVVVLREKKHKMKYSLEFLFITSYDIKALFKSLCCLPNNVKLKHCCIQLICGYEE